MTGPRFRLNRSAKGALKKIKQYLDDTKEILTPKGFLNFHMLEIFPLIPIASDCSMRDAHAKRCVQATSTWCIVIVCKVLSLHHKSKLSKPPFCDLFASKLGLNLPFMLMFRMPTPFDFQLS